MLLLLLLLLLLLKLSEAPDVPGTGRNTSRT
jgi:hypothetical protein